jgi:LacI family transcriptional regulator
MKSRKAHDIQEKKAVALIMPPVPSYSRTLMEGVSLSHSTSRAWHLIDLPHWKVGRSPLPVRHDRVDGAIVWADRRDLWINRLAHEGVKMINCGSDWIGVPGVVSVYVDRKMVCKTLVDHIHSIGLRQLVLVGYLISKRPGMLRFLDEVSVHGKASGMEVAMWELEGRHNPEDAPRRLLEADREHKLKAMLQRIPKPAAVFCENDHIGVLVCRVAKMAGIRIPEDLAVVGYGNNLISRFSEPPLTSMSPPGEMIGKAAAEVLAEWFGNNTSQPDDVVVPHAKIELRESTLGRSGDAALERVHRFIRRNDHHGVSLTTLAAIANMSTKTLISKYTEAYGLAPLDDLRKRRLDKAMSLLRRTDLSINEVAESCGFYSQANFYNYFLRHTGMSPTNYRVEGPSHT